MKYTVKHLGRNSDTKSDYQFLIFEGTKVVAEYRHDFRNDEKAIRTSGDWISCGEILSGGGPQPLIVSVEGETLLERLLSEGN